MNDGTCQNPKCDKPALVSEKTGKPMSYCSEACRVMAGRLKRNPPKSKEKAAKLGPLDNIPTGKVDPERLARFLVSVARKLAEAEKEMHEQADFDAMLKRKRCLDQIAGISKRSDVRQYFPQKANKMSEYVSLYLPTVNQSLEAQKQQLQAKFI